jgi:hypothetical protein
VIPITRIDSAFSENKCSEWPRLPALRMTAVLQRVALGLGVASLEIDMSCNKVLKSV